MSHNNNITISIYIRVIEYYIYSYRTSSLQQERRGWTKRTTIEEEESTIPGIIEVGYKFLFLVGEWGPSRRPANSDRYDKRDTTPNGIPRCLSLWTGGWMDGRSNTNNTADASKNIQTKIRYILHSVYSVTSLELRPKYRYSLYYYGSIHKSSVNYN